MSHLPSTSTPRLGAGRALALLIAAVSLSVAASLLVTAGRTASPAGEASSAATDGVAATASAAPDADEPEEVGAVGEAPADPEADAAEASGEGSTTASTGTVPSASTTTVSMTEFSFAMPTTYEAGTHTFEVVNDGDVPHEFALGEVGAHHSHLGGTDWIDGGGSQTVSLDLAPGDYEIGCHVPGHYEAGMTTTITVVE